MYLLVTCVAIFPLSCTAHDTLMFQPDFGHLADGRNEYLEHPV